MEYLRKIKQPGSWRWITYVAILLLFPSLLTFVYLVRRPAYDHFWADNSAPRLSDYDHLIHRYARANGMDWRLVASIIYVESKFRHEAVSSAGARGLMQIMPVVARENRVRWIHRPEDNIRAGVQHFQSKLKRIKGQTPDDTLRLSLAAYNVGLGHLRDAQRLAMQMKKSPRRWKDVSQAFSLLEDAAHYESAEYGYCQGRSVIAYVTKVMRQYRHYRNLYPAEPVHLTQSSGAEIDPRT